MSEDAQESAPEQAESQELAAPAISQVSGDKQSSGTPIDVEQVAKKVAELLKPDIEKTAQSVKDKRFSKIEGELGEIAARLGVPEEKVRQARREILLDKIEEQGFPSEKPDQAKVWEREWQTASSAMLQQAAEDFGVKIDRKDPDYQAILKKEYPTEAHAYQELNRLIAKRVKQSQTPSAAVVAEGAGVAPASGDIQTLTDNLSRLVANGAPSKQIEDAKEALIAAMSK